MTPALEQPEAAPLTIYCPGGTRIKSSVSSNELWVSATDWMAQVAPVVPGIGSYLGPLIAQLAPSLRQLVPLCASLPPLPPTITLEDLFLSGQWAAVPQWFVDWAWSYWGATQWDAFCECAPVLGPGTCPPVPQFSGTLTGSLLNSWKPAGQANCPHGWSTITLTMNVSGSSLGTEFSCAWNLLDATGTSVMPSGLRSQHNVTVGTPTVVTTAGPTTQAGRDAARTLTLEGRPRGVSPQTSTSQVTATYSISATFSGTCQDVPVIPPPPPDPPPPVTPTAPAPPPLATGCTTDQLCQRLDQLQRMLSIVSTEVDETYIWTHAHLPVNCPDCICPPVDGGGGSVVCGAPAYVDGTVHAGLELDAAIAVSGLVGMRIGITERPGEGLVLEGNPPYLWDMGWMSILNADGLLEEKRITREGMVWLPYSMRLASSWSCTLKDGVQLTAVELLPAP